MAKSLQTKIIFNGIDRVSGMLRGMSRGISGFQKSISNAGRSMRSVGFGVSAAFTAPVIAGIRSMTSTAAEFETQSLGFAALQKKGKAFQQTMKAIRSEVFAISQESIFTPSETMTAAANLARMGLAGTTSMNSYGKAVSEVSVLLKHSSDLAAAGQFDISAAADKLTNSVLAFYGKPLLKDASGNITSIIDIDAFEANTKRISDALVATATSSNTTIEQLLNAFKSAAPIAKLVGMPLTELTSRLGIMADVGFKGAEAGNAIRTGYLRMIAPTRQVITALAGIGVELSDFISYNKTLLTTNSLMKQMAQTGASAGMKNLKGRISDVMGKGLKPGAASAALKDELTKGLKQSDAKEVTKAIDAFYSNAVESVDYQKFIKAVMAKNAGVVPASLLGNLFGKRQMAKFAAEGMDPKSLDRLRDTITAKIAGSLASGNTTLAADLAATMMGGLPGAFKRAASAMDVFQIRLTEAVSPEIVSFLANLRSGLNWFIESTSKATKKFVVFGAILAATAGPLLIYLGLVTQGLAAMLSPLKMLLMPIRALSVALGLLRGMTLALGASLLPLVAVLAAVAAAGVVLYNSWDGIKDIMGPHLSAAIERISNAMSALFKGDWKAMAHEFGMAWKDMKLAAKGAMLVIGGEWDILMAKFDKIMPNFEGFRESLSNIGEAFLNLWNAVFSGSSGASMQSFKEWITWLGDGALGATTVLINGMATAIEAVAAAIDKIKKDGLSGIFSGEVGGGLLALTGFAATAAALGGVAKGLGLLKIAMAGFKVARLVAVVGAIAALGGVDLAAIALGVGGLVKVFNKMRGVVPGAKAKSPSVSPAQADKRAGRSAGVKSGIKSSSSWRPFTKAEMRQMVRGAANVDRQSKISAGMPKSAGFMKGLKAGVKGGVIGGLALWAGQKGIDKLLGVSEQERRYMDKVSGVGAAIDRLFNGKKYETFKQFQAGEYAAEKAALQRREERQYQIDHAAMLARKAAAATPFTGSYGGVRAKQMTDPVNRLLSGDTPDLAAIKAEASQARAEAASRSAELKASQDSTTQAVNSQTGQIVGAINSLGGKISQATAANKGAGSPTAPVGVTKVASTARNHI